MWQIAKPKVAFEYCLIPQEGKFVRDTEVSVSVAQIELIR